MTWAARRRVLYLFGVITFLLAVFGGPIAYTVLTIPPTCHDGIQNQGETAPDRGGPCLLLDERLLSPHAVLWARAFRVRAPGTASSTVGALYNAIAYVQNPNQGAGVMEAHYRFSFYDAENLLVAERDGVAAIMPGGVTPIFEGGIDTGNRSVVHTSFVFTDPLIWEKVKGTTDGISVGNVVPDNLTSVPRIAALATNQSPAPVLNVVFSAVVFDRGGNAIASSQTTVDRIDPSGAVPLTFTWPDPFPAAIGKIEILAILPPLPDVRALR